VHIERPGERGEGRDGGGEHRARGGQAAEDEEREAVQAGDEEGGEGDEEAGEEQQEERKPELRYHPERGQQGQATRARILTPSLSFSLSFLILCTTFLLTLSTATLDYPFVYKTRKLQPSIYHTPFNTPPLTSP